LSASTSETDVTRLELTPAALRVLSAMEQRAAAVADEYGEGSPEHVEILRSLVNDPNSLIEVPKGGSFDDMLALKGDKEIGDKINKIISKLAEANDLQKVIDLADFNDEEKLGKGKEMQDRLTKLVTIFNDLDFRRSRAEGDDLLGDAYEYLMRHFATESGKSKGQFYTPAEVSRILAKVVGISPHTRQDQTVYDPTCGSGSLLLKVAAEAPRGVTIYGQEKDNATWALSKMNMILHGNEDADIQKQDTLTSPQFIRGSQLEPSTSSS
jgi:type I restriction enzyme M protein